MCVPKSSLWPPTYTAKQKRGQIHFGFLAGLLFSSSPLFRHLNRLLFGTEITSYCFIWTCLLKIAHVWRILLYLFSFCLRTMSIFITQACILYTLTFSILCPFSGEPSSFYTASYHLLWFQNKLYFITRILMATNFCPVLPAILVEGTVFCNPVDCSSCRQAFKRYLMFFM